MNGVAPSRVHGGVDSDKFSGTRADEFSTGGDSRRSHPPQGPGVKVAPFNLARTTTRAAAAAAAAASRHRPRHPRA